MPRPITLLALLPLLVLSACDDGSATPDLPLAGTWLGTVDPGSAPLRVVFDIARGADGGFSAKLHSPDQGAFDIPVTLVAVRGRHVDLVVAALGATFSGDLNAAGTTISGTAVQGGETLPLNLEKQSGPFDRRRPQDPPRPYPYDIADVTVTTSPAVRLACTATWPRAAGPFRTAVLITGSGPQDRDEELVNHRPFLVLADALTRAGVATLRCDDRGVGASTGDFAAATSLDFADDVRAAVAFLRTSAPFPVAAIGLIGHSEGGLVGPLAADGNADVAFLVLLAAPGVTGEQILLSQTRAIGAARGMTTAQLDAAEALNRQLFAQFGMTSDAGELDRRLRQILAGAGLRAADIDRNVATLNTPWMRFFIPHDPARVLRRTRVPVLALNGSLDLQVLPALNLPAVEAALREGGNGQVTAQTLPGLNHLFQHATSGLPDEYGSIAETMSPEVLKLVSDWIAAR